MKGIKALGLIAMTALALTVCSGVASAAAPGYFTAGSYPASISASASGGQLTTAFGATPCGTKTAPALGSMSAPTDTLSGTAEKFCAGNIYVDLNMNGCEFILHPPSEGTQGTVDIGGAKCTGITGYQIVGGTMTIPPQKGLAASFANEGSGTGAKVKVSVAAEGLKYENSLYGSYSNGKYTNTWVLSAEASGAATGLSVKPGPGLSYKPGLFETINASVTVGGTTEGEIEGVEFFRSEAKTGAGVVRCPTTYTAPMALYAWPLEATPTFGKCTITGVAATAAPKAGCVYSYSTNIHLCETEFTAGSCKITIPAQTVGEVTFANVGTGANAHVEAKTKRSGTPGLQYSVSGSGCPKEKAPGSYSDGSYVDVVQLAVAKVG